MRYNLADLHIHSFCSDGVRTPRQAVEEADAAGLQALSLTDHDTVAGIDEARRAADELKIEVVPGAELSAHIGEREVHILAYCFEWKDPRLLEHVGELHQKRYERGVAIVERLLSRVSPRLGHAVGDLLARFIHGLAALRTPSAYLEILVSSCLLNLGYILITWFSFAAFGFHEAPEFPGSKAALVVMAISSIGIVIPAQGGIGTYHFFYGTCLHRLFAIPLASAMACATLVHGISSLTYFVIGAPALLVQRRRHGQRASMKDTFEQASEDSDAKNPTS